METENNQNQEQIIPEQTLTTNQIQLPNTGGVLAMGIISLVSFCCVPLGLISITLAILAVVFGNRAIKEYNFSPEKYTLKSLKNIKAGRTCGIISLGLGGLWIIGVLIYLSIIGWAIGTAISTMPWDMF